MIKVYVHAVPQKITTIANRFGKQITKTTDRWWIGVVCGDKTARFVSEATTNNFVADTEAILKGLQFAIDNGNGEKTIEVYSSQQRTGEVSKSNLANFYLDQIEVAASRNRVHLVNRFISGAENPAVKVSRYGCNPPTPAPAAVEKPAITWIEWRANRPPPPDFTDAELDAYIAVMHSTDLSKSARKKRYVKMRDAARRRLDRPDITGDTMRQAALSRYFLLLEASRNGATPCDAAPPSR